MLALRQGQPVGRSKGVNLLIQTQDHFTQSLIRLRLSNGMLFRVSSYNLAIFILGFMLLGADRSVTNAEFIGRTHLIAVLLKNSQFLHDRNRSLTGLQRSGRRGQSGGRHQTDQHDQS